MVICGTEKAQWQLQLSDNARKMEMELEVLRDIERIAGGLSSSVVGKGPGGSPHRAPGQGEYHERCQNNGKQAVQIDDFAIFPGYRPQKRRLLR
jgi:hypothetical protein